MKLLFTEGIGASQTTTNAQDEKIPVYETKAAAENDLANLEVGQIVATKDEGNELSNPVDVVQDGNMHAVTSNAVADAFKTRVRFPDYSKQIKSGMESTGWIATEDCYMTINVDSPKHNLKIDGNIVQESSNSILAFSGYVKKGSKIMLYNNDIATTASKFYAYALV